MRFLPQVWRVNDKDKVQLSPSDQSKFYTGDCYIFQYTYPGDDKEECLIGTWFGKKSIEEDRLIAVSLASKMVESAKFQAIQARFYEGKEPIQFFVIINQCGSDVVVVLLNLLLECISQTRLQSSGVVLPFQQTINDLVVNDLIIVMLL
ncbi:Villin-4 [Zea mays]|uniref:Villin-4 n=1 Tax=Zea mays TaxID=4577 RepID=A0A1D6GSR6_MAIZE|nr:Villin-4 [Zea mays]